MEGKMNEAHQTQKALSDLEALKHAVLLRKNQSPLGVDSVELHHKLHIIALTFVVCLVILDFPEKYLLTTDVLASAGDAALQMSGIVSAGVVLLMFLAGGYGLVAFQARKQRQKYDEYTERYFTHFRNLSLFSDLFVKYAAFCAIILAGKPEWLAPALLLFTGDWVMQGRFFVLGARLSTLLGLACFAGALVMFLTGAGLMMIPLIVFLGINMFSLVGIVGFKKKIKNQDTGEQ